MRVSIINITNKIFIELLSFFIYTNSELYMGFYLAHIYSSNFVIISTSLSIINSIVSTIFNLLEVLSFFLLSFFLFFLTILPPFLISDYSITFGFRLVNYFLHIFLLFFKMYNIIDILATLYYPYIIIKNKLYQGDCHAT